MTVYAYRYRAYAASQGLSTDAVMERDREQYPGGVMAGYMSWIDEQWRAWLKETKRRGDFALSKQDHDDFDARLARIHGVTP